MKHIKMLVIAAIVALGLSACGGGGGTAAPTPAPPTTAAPASSSAPTPSTTAPAAPAGAIVARAAADLAVFAAPGDAAPSQTLPASTSFGSARALLVTEQQGEWLHVLLPVRPNGSTGWIRAADVTLRTVRLHIDVDLGARTLSVRDGDSVVLSTPVAIGAPDDPTPTGEYFVVDKLATGQDDGPYGPFALGLSGHSDVLTEFAGGDGQIGIHGTDDPSSIGRDVSHGCVRVPNDITRQLNDLVPLGTPVTIR